MPPFHLRLPERKRDFKKTLLSAVSADPANGFLLVHRAFSIDALRAVGLRLYPGVDLPHGQQLDLPYRNILVVYAR